MAIITEDDLDIAEDFFDYFLATAPLLKLDRTVWCISAYNDNGATMTTDRNRTDLFYRTDFFPGLGWLLTSELWDELSPIWPDAYWDDWLRKQEIRKNRVCIRPEISRTSHNMQLAGNGSSRGLFGKFLSSIRLAEKPYNFSNYNVNNLYKESYDIELGKKLAKTQFIDVYDINEGMRPNATFEYRIEYKNQAQFRRIARMFKLMDVSSNSLAICVEDGSILQNASLPSLKRLNFAENRLRVLPSNAFLKFPNLTNLDLSDNPISTIYPGAFDQIQLEVLAMNTTSLLCDCKMQWFSDWLFQSGLDKARIQTTCSYPVALQGIDLRFIDVSNLTCANESPQAQIILQPVQTLKAIIDRDTRLSCSGYGAKPLEVQWKMFEKNGRSRLLAEDSTLIFFTNHTQENQDAYSGNELAYSELRFLKITRQDEAEYQCIVKNSYGTAYSDRARLLVRKLPEFLDVPHDIVTVAGRNIGFPCRATGIPQPIISWEKDSSKTFPAAIERRMHIMQDDHSLYILNVSKADAGVYTCSAANDAGEVGVSARLEVYEISFQSHLENKRVSDGDSLKFHCSVQAEPSVSINWFHNAEMVPVNQTSRIYMYGEMSEYLVIEQARSSDSGTYSCGVTVKGITLARQSAKVHVLPSLTLSFETSVGDLNASEALQLSSTRPMQLAHEDLPNNDLRG
uniref:Alpha-1,3-mannosyl-glycoprotein 2-beta-N-acetylglucosaminyltransferase n=1 Tax=Acrobeloides nanus TaxID=290746 RepID=A0A914DSE4_9BILA